MAFVLLYVGKICVTDGSPLVPFEHGVDGLAQFGAACLVYAARIDPGELQPIRLSQLAGHQDLLEALLPRSCLWMLKILV